MENFLIYFVAVFLVVVAVCFVNEKFIKIPTEIALLGFALIIGFTLKVMWKLDVDFVVNDIMKTMTHFRLDKLLMDGILCFMLFTGASQLKLPSLVHNFKPISLLALLATVLTSVIYGVLFWVISLICGLNFSFILCCLLGSIVSPTDPIAATAILNKCGLSKDVTAIMEGESLFNDGTGVALFIFIKDLYLDTSKSPFLVVMCRELFGAIVVGFVVSFVFFFFIKATKDPIKHIIISMVSVALCYVICEHFGFSGVIASVICGIYFSTMMDKYQAADKEIDPNNYYKEFWSVIDTILNYVLYVIIGLSFIFIDRIRLYPIVAIAVVIINLVARYIGVLIATVASRQLPEGYKAQPFTLLMTWSGLKGGLCLALALSASEFLGEGSPELRIVLFVTYVTILFTTGIQGMTVGKLYEYIKSKLGLKSE